MTIAVIELIINMQNNDPNLGPNLSLNEPVIRPPKTSPKPKTIIPNNAFFSFSFCSSRVLNCYFTIIGVNKPV